MKILSTIWLIARSSPKAAYYISLALRYLPSALSLLTKIRAVFGSESVQEVLKAWSEFIDKVAPPAPAADGAGTLPDESKREQRRRFFRFMDRTKAAGCMTDGEVRIACTAHHLQPYHEERSFNSYA